MFPIAILCGGKGTRVASIAGDLPKALLPVDGYPFLGHQLHWLRDAGASDIVLLVGYRGDRIRAFVGDGNEFGLRVRYADDGAAPRGTGGALKDALPLLGERFLTVYGDALSLADPSAVAAALTEPFEGVMTVFRNDDRWQASNVRVAGDRVAAYDKHAPPGSMTHIDYGFNAFRARAFDMIPDGGPADLADVHRAMIERGSLRALPVTERWHEVGTPEGLAETEAWIRGRRSTTGPS